MSQMKFQVKQHDTAQWGLHTVDRIQIATNGSRRTNAVDQTRRFSADTMEMSTHPAKTGCAQRFTTIWAPNGMNVKAQIFLPLKSCDQRRPELTVFSSKCKYISKLHGVLTNASFWKLASHVWLNFGRQNFRTSTTGTALQQHVMWRHASKKLLSVKA